MRIHSLTLDDGDVFTVVTPYGNVIVDYQKGEPLFVGILQDAELRVEVDSEVILDTGVEG